MELPREEAKRLKGRAYRLRVEEWRDGAVHYPLGYPTVDLRPGQRRTVRFDGHPSVLNFVISRELRGRVAVTVEQSPHRPLQVVEGEAGASRLGRHPFLAAVLVLFVAVAAVMLLGAALGWFLGAGLPQAMGAACLVFWTLGPPLWLGLNYWLADAEDRPRIRRRQGWLVGLWAVVLVVYLSLVYVLPALGGD